MTSSLASSTAPHCACQPAKWEFTLDFSRSTDCTATSWHSGDLGIASLTCSATSTNARRSANPTILEVVDYVEIREADTQQNWLSYSSEPQVVGPLWNGESFTYTSVLAAAPQTDQPLSLEANRNENAERLPSAINVHLFGITPKQEVCEFDFSIYFSNDCNAFPIIEGGDYIGPVTVTRVLDPPETACPIVLTYYN